MRFGSVLQRRLVKLEATIKVLSPRDKWNQIVSQALSNLSVEELRLLRDVAEMRAAGTVVKPNPEYEVVLQRANALCAQSLAEYNASVGKERAIA
jgi:hypothetical protein